MDKINLFCNLSEFSDTIEFVNSEDEDSEDGENQDFELDECIWLKCRRTVDAQLFSVTFKKNNTREKQSTAP